MLSSDQNVETISQLVEVVRHYIGLQSEYVKLDVIEKVVRLLTVMAIVAMFALLLIIMMIYFSFAGNGWCVLRCRFVLFAGAYPICIVPQTACREASGALSRQSFNV